MYDASYLKTFIDECNDHLATVENDLIELERTPDRVDPELVNRVFRAAHSIKGGAGFFDLDTIRELAHKLENVLDLVRSGQVRPNAEVVNTMLNGFDRLRALLGDPQASAGADIADELVALDGLATSYLPEQRKAEVLEIKSYAVPNSACVLQGGALQLRGARESGSGISLIRCDLIHDVQRLGKTPLQIIRELDENGLVFDSAIDTLAVGDLDSEEVSPVLPFYILYGSKLPVFGIARLLDIPPAGVTLMEMPIQAKASAAPPAAAGGEAPGRKSARAAKAPKAEAPAAQAGVTPPTGAASREGCPDPAQDPAARKPGQGEADGSVRVSVAVLDSLMNIAGELVLARNELLEGLTEGAPPAVKRSGRRIDSVTREIQETVMLTRMQPISMLFDRFPRIVRDMARSTGKQIELNLDGREVEVDRTILELLSDPMTHIIRNACDHGIEAPETRRAARKPEGGTIALRARYEGGSVLVEVRDDGKGIDLEAVAAKAVKLGHMTADQVSRMTEKEKASLIMLPGLSTAKEVTDLSGRGVGMDVVKTNIDRLGGQIETQTERGKGTVFRVRLPLTLAIMPSLLVTVGEERYAIPQTNVEEMLRVRAGDVKTRIERVGDKLVLVLRGEFLPIIRLSQVLGIPQWYTDPDSGERRPDNRTRLEDRRGRSGGGEVEAQERERSAGDRRYRADSDLSVVLVNSSNLRYAVVVDSIQDTMEIVVKPLGRHFAGLREYSGATILGNGATALILDTSGLAARAGLNAVNTEMAVATESDAATEQSSGMLDLLTFGNGPDERAALPMAAVDRVRRIKRAELSSVGATRVWTSGDKALPVFALAECLDMADILACDGELALVIMQAAGRDAGLLVTPPVDFRSTPAALDRASFGGPGLSGSMVIDGRNTLIVDPPGLFRELRPDWFAGGAAGDGPPAAAGGGVPATGQDTAGQLVLVADDSAFFRDKISDLLGGAGYRVICAEDGGKAWESYQANPGIAAAVVDLEMPVMDGTALARLLRQADPAVPIIALTSLASDDDRRRALEAGVTEFMIKLDEQELVSGLARLVQGAKL